MKGTHGLLRVNGSVIGRLGTWECVPIAQGPNQLLEARFGMGEADPGDQDPSVPTRVTLYDGEACKLDGMYYVNASVILGLTELRRGGGMLAKMTPAGRVDFF